MPRDEREFPDLAPIRGREARARDGGAPAGQAPAAQAPAGQASIGQAPAAQASRPPEEPDWSDPDSVEAFSARWRRRGSESRGDRRADRRKRRRLYILGGTATAAVIAVIVYFLVGGNSGPANVGIGSLVTTFLPGELQQVPDACGIVPSGTLSQYLPAQPKIAAPPLNSGASSQCTWTLDKPPTYRVLEVYLNVYSPNALVDYGNGSATFAAINAYAEDETIKQHPGPKSGQPNATITTISNLGSDAFESMQVFHENGAISDMATVYVRYRNVIITVVANGLDQGNGATKYGPISQSTLSAAAQTVAQQVTATIVH